MKLPKSAPKIAGDQILAALQALSNPEVQELINHANSEYFHWEEFKYRRMPAGLKAEQLWQLVKYSRSTGRRTLPLKDSKERAFSYWLPPAAMVSLHEVDRWGGSTTLKIDGSASLESMREQVVVSSLMEEAIATAQIEGAATTRVVAKAMLRENRKPRDRSEQMIFNGYSTMQLLRKRRDQKLSLDFLFEIQSSMTNQTLDDATAAGRLRTSKDNIAIVDVRNDDVLFTPPPAEQLGRRLQALIDFANAPTGAAEEFIHPLVKASILHFWLAYEHPFVDGNGRTARAVFYWFMLKSGYWLFEFLTVSRVIVKKPGAYYKSFLYSEHDEEDLTYSLLFLLEATQQAMADLRDYLRLKQEEQREVARTLRSFPDLNHRQRSVLDQLLKHPDDVVTFKGHASTHDITIVTARADLLDLTSRKLLDEVSLGRQRGFIPVANLAELIAAKAGKA